MRPSDSVPTISRRTRRRIYLLFAVPVAFLAAQFLLDRAGLGEPYPGLKMPEFEGTRTGSDNIIRTNAIEVEVLFADASERTTMAALLAPMPSSILSTVASNLFRSTPVRARATQQVAFRHRVRAVLTPSLDRRTRRRAEGNPPSPELKQWTRSRLAAMYPGRIAKEMVVHWFEDQHRLRGRAVERVGRVEFNTYRMPLQ
jgi:hypothetical protein